MRSVAARSAAVLLALGVVSGASPANAEAETPFIDLGTLSGVAASVVVAVNDHGLVVGLSSAGSGGPSLPSTWNRAGHVTVLPVLPGGENLTWPTAVNDRGEIIGRETTADGHQHALRWNRDGGVEELRYQPDSTVVNASAINDAGAIIGSAGDNPYYGSLIRWDRSGRADVLPYLPGMQFSWVTAINDRGTVVGGGYRQWSSVPVPGAWDRDGVPRLLELPPGVDGASISDVNNRGSIVGSNIVWDPAGNPSILPGQYASAVQINDRGTILGTAYVGSSGMPTAVRWRDGKLSQLALPPTGQWASVTAENNDDITIGDAVLSPHQVVPVWWDRGGAVHRLACPTPNDIDYPCTAVAVNDHGIAVGQGIVTEGSGGRSRALIWKLHP